jgi:hypothetical protein
VAGVGVKDAGQTFGDRVQRRESEIVGRHVAAADQASTTLTVGLLVVAGAAADGDGGGVVICAQRDVMKLKRTLGRTAHCATDIAMILSHAASS